MSYSDGHVNDQRGSVVESIEDADDVSMRDDGSSDSEGISGAAQRRIAGLNPVDDRRKKIHGQTASTEEDEASEDGSDSGDDDDAASEESPRSRDGSGYGVTAGSTDDRLESRGQIPPSGQASSSGSDYSPSGSDSTASDGDQRGEDDSSSDQATTKLTPRKRKYPTEGVVSAVASDFRPLKRAKGSINRAYLNLLNEDIKHAATQYVPRDGEQFDGRIGLPFSQIGMTNWTVLEKERFFVALGRLGRDDAAGIAHRVRTKGEFEVRQYLKLLEDGLAHRRRQDELDPIELTDFPAALELSQDCCEALEEAADNVALRQGNSEDAAEEQQHGTGWLLTQENSKEFANDGTGTTVPEAADVFRVAEWLNLSERFFMNAPEAPGNWQTVDGDRPSIRATTMEDFCSLALMLTKRLVAASIYMATSRIRAERGYKATTVASVREKDVQAAVLSLGLATQKPPLTKCVRHFGLSVYENPPKHGENNGEEPMHHDDVENAIGIEGEQGLGQVRRELERVGLSSDESSASADDATASDSGDEIRPGKEAQEDDVGSDEAQEIEDEASEAILYSAVDPPQTKRDRQALVRRIEAERAAERHADAVDAQASYLEEAKMWEVLGQQPPSSMVDPGPPAPGRRQKISVESSYTVGKDWRAKTRVMSEWEAEYLGI